MSSGSQPGAHVEGLRSKMTQTRLQPVAEPANGRRACARIATADGSVGPEAVDQAGTTRSLQLVGATAARAVCGVAGSHVPGCFSETGAVDMADDGRAVAALGPVSTGGVAAGR